MLTTNDWVMGTTTIIIGVFYVYTLIRFSKPVTSELHQLILKMIKKSSR